jgi:hypothetical protein
MLLCDEVVFRAIILNGNVVQVIEETELQTLTSRWVPHETWADLRSDIG